MRTHYYLSFFPIEALIASQLEPDEFGRYMALGTKRGSREPIMFIEVEGEFGSDFDWQYVKERCVPHKNGEPKHSLWLRVYRVLEHIPVERMGAMHLTTADGRTLSLEKSTSFEGATRSFYVYQEITPLTPLVVSALPAKEFAHYMTDPSNHVSVPRMIFADLKVIDFENIAETGNIGGAYDRNLEHLKQCVHDVTTLPDKQFKNVERSVRSFSYQIIGDGVFVGDQSGIVVYPMPDIATLRRDHYDWGRSAMVF
jgi:hypothetical protein